MKRQTGAVLAKAHYGAMNGMPIQRGRLAAGEGGALDRRHGREGVGDADAERQRPVRPVPPRARLPPVEQRGIATPFRWLRRLQPGRLYVLAGETAHGKTVLGGQYAKAACQDGARSASSRSR
jgi:hypothetical protein